MKMINKAEIDGNGNIVIQNTDNSIITINRDNPEEIRKFFIDFQNQLSELPKQILDLMEAQNPNRVSTTGANIYLGLKLFTPFVPQLTNTQIAFGVTFTNLTKENRFFNSPFFKSSVPFDDNGNDALVMIKIIGEKEIFPKKLEYGEVVSQNYEIVKNSKELYDKLIARDQYATIQAIVSTTIGEVYKSNEYSIAKLLENFRYAQ